jgi:hypothetical protein
MHEQLCVHVGGQVMLLLLALLFLRGLTTVNLHGVSFCVPHSAAVCCLQVAGSLHTCLGHFCVELSH